MLFLKLKGLVLIRLAIGRHVVVETCFAPYDALNFTVVLLVYVSTLAEEEKQFLN
jgi:hypothetical protein